MSSSMDNKPKIEITELECKRCGKKWYPSSPELPEVCPRCKSYSWWKEKENNEEKK